MTIGIITNDDTQVFQADIIAGVRERMLPAGHEVRVAAIGEPPHETVTLPADDLDGLIVIANVLSEKHLVDLSLSGRPMTLVSHRVAGLPIPAVIQNNVEGINRLVDYLVAACGRRQLAFIAGDMNQHDGVARTQMYEHRLMHHDILPLDGYILPGDFIPSMAYDTTLAFIDSGAPFDGVIAADYLMGVAA
ncbi:MAG: substrate-binding domain-containing protein, partial [Chloroflexota bacterium]